MSSNFHTPVATTSAANASTFNAPLGQLDSAISSLGGTSNPFSRAAFVAATILTIASGVITPTQSLHLVAAESGTSDTLTTITAVANSLLFIKADAGDTITIDASGGNINTFDGDNFSLTGNTVIALFCQNSQWSVIGKYSSLDPLIPTFSYINGFEYTINNDETFTIGGGECTGVLGTQIIQFPSGGGVDVTASGINGIDTGAVAANTDYMIYACVGSSGVGFVLSTNATTPTLPNGYDDDYRRIGSCITDATSDLLWMSSRLIGNLRENRYTMVTKAAPYQFADSVNLGNGSGAATAFNFTSPNMISFFTVEIIALVGCETASAAVDVFWYSSGDFDKLIMPNLTTGHAFWSEMILPIDGGIGNAYGDADDEDFSLYLFGYREQVGGVDTP